MPLMPHHNHLCLTEGGLEIIISKLNRIKSAIELCVYAFSNFYRTAIIMNLLAAMGAYCFFATKPEVNFEYEVPESNGQIVLWQ